MLHLEPGVHLEEVELVADEEALDRAGGDVADRARELERVRPRASHARARRPSARVTPRSASGGAAGRSSRADRAGRRAAGVPEHLDLDVPRIFEVALEVDLRVAEEALARRRAPRRARPPAPSRPAATRKPIPPPPPEAFTATGYPISLRDGESVVERLHGAVAPRHDRDPEPPRAASRAPSSRPSPRSPPATGRRRRCRHPRTPARRRRSPRGSRSPGGGPRTRSSAPRQDRGECR